MPTEKRTVSEQRNAQTTINALLTKLAKKASEKNTAAFEGYAFRALRIAKVEGDPLMTAMVHLQLANAYLLTEKLKPALNEFRKATAQARASRETGGSLAIEVELHALDGEGSVFFAMESYAVAGEVYKEVAEIADSAGQCLPMINGWLMATFCHEMQGRYLEAFRCCEYALLAGEKLPKNERPKEGIAQAGDSLLRIGGLLKQENVARLSPNTFSGPEEVDLRMSELIGDDWRNYLPRKG